MNYYKTATEIFLSNFFQNVFNFMGEVAPYDEPEPNQIGSFFGSTPHSLFGAALALAFHGLWHRSWHNRTKHRKKRFWS
jgi:hypothetical protein